MNDIRLTGTLDDETDVITARRYQHPALRERPVVRLVARTLAPAEDLTTEYLGFTAPSRVAEVGYGDKEALGFPAWALVHDPANAHHALNLVKDIEKLARLAKSKPGAAKDKFTELGEMLGRSAPHFLPTFYEQVGRIYLDAGNLQYAATMFGKAREAEQVHSLKVTPDHLRQVFLEFSFAGAVTAKALSSHAKTLPKTRSPQEAFEEFTRLCVERIKGGLTPYSGMAEDIRKLTKAAKLDVATAEQDFLRQVIDTPVMDVAPAAFWKAYRKPLTALATEEPAVRGRLLAIVPDTEAHDMWIEILTESATSAALTEPAGTVDPQAEAPGGPAAWLGRFARSRTGYSPPGRSVALLDLVSAMAPRLRADGAPVDLFGRGAELDVVDLCLAEDIPLAQPEEPPSFDVGEWLRDTEPGRRDLAKVAADPRMLHALGQSLASTYLHYGRMDKTLKPVLDCVGLRAALQHWLGHRADEVHNGSLVEMSHQLRQLRAVRTANAFVDSASALERITGTNVAAALASMLRTGIFDEFGWPALDEAVAKLTSRKNVKPEFIGESWPAVILGTDDQIVVVGPSGVLMTHVAQVPVNLRPAYGDPDRFATYVDGRLLVMWRGPEGTLGYWSDAPDSIFTVTDGGWAWRRLETASLQMADGGLFIGSRVLHPGDTELPSRTFLHSDGTSYWRLDWVDSDHVWREVDPATGAGGRVSLPSWIENFAADGRPIDMTESWLRPAAPGTDASPLGHSGGMLGWRVRQEAEGIWLGERIDGGSVRFAGGRAPFTALKFPGTDELSPVTYGWYNFDLYDPTGTVTASFGQGFGSSDLAQGTPFTPPQAWWPCLQVRDEKGSLALRAITEEQAQQLLDGKDVAEVLPEITHPGLVAGVRGVVAYAAVQRDEVRSYAELAEPEVTTVQVGNQTMLDALTWLGRGYGSAGDETEGTVLRTISALGSLSGERKLFGSIMFDTWEQQLACPAAVVWRAASPLTPENERVALVAFLEAVATSELTDGRWRLVNVKPPKSYEDEDDDGMVVTTPDGFLAVWEGNEWSDDGWLHAGLQFSANDGSFTLPKEWTLSTSQAIDTVLDSTRIRQFLSALATNGPLSWRPADVTTLSQDTGLSEAEATYLLAGLPNLRAYDTNFLDTETREALGLSSAVARSARGRFGHQSLNPLTLLGSLVPANPADLWTSGPNLSGAAEEWVKLFGKRSPVPDEVLSEAEKVLPVDNVADLISAAANPDATGWLTTDGKMSYVDGNMTGPDRGFQTDHIVHMRNVLPWLAYGLPINSPIRARLARALELTRARLRNPDLFYYLARTYEDSNKALLSLLRLPSDLTDAQLDVDELRLYKQSWDESYEVHLRVADYRPERQQLLDAVCAVTGDEENSEPFPVLFSQGLTDACSVTGESDGYFQDPYMSVPDLVESAAAKYTLDKDAAALYLQILALPDPTDANVAKWLGWKPARLRAARTALGATDLVLTAKRSRAGRSLFLPGGWLPLKSPYLPLESWKVPLFGLQDGPVAVITPPGTVEQAFRTAWQRIENGDVPVYEELRTR